MDFSITSLYFFIFLAVLFPAYFLCPKKFRWITLLVASLVFFVLCSWKAIFFVLFATLTTYGASIGIFKIKNKEKAFLADNPEIEIDAKKAAKAKFKKQRKTFMVLGIVALVVVLAVMKYLDFLIGNVNAIIGWFDSSKHLSLVNLFLPLGISFYTFQAIGYLADVYWGKYEPEKNFFKFLLFMSFFPKIMQGPIIRYNEIAPSLFGGNDFDYQNFTDGLKRIGWGLFKKLCIANTLFVFTKFAFLDPSQISGFEAFLAVVCYFISDYCDFSGYMDIACGTALCMGVKLPENFNHPYFAKGIDDYWRRWHITLGAWFKDYIFYPLSISKFSLALGKKSKKIFKKHANKVPAIFGLIIVWFLTGLWHGASWNYVLWGLYFGLIIIFGIIVEPLFDKFYNKTKINRNAGWVNAIRLVRTLLLLAFGKILFETASLSGTFDFISKLFDGNNYFGTTALYEHLGWASFIVAVVLSIAVLVVDIIQERHPTTTFLEKLRKIPLWVQWTLFILLIVCIVWFGYYGSGLPKFEFGYVVF